MTGRWSVEVATFPGHPHGYAWLWTPDRAKIEVKWRIDQATADRWNDADPDLRRPQFRDLGWRAGDETERFPSREAAMAAAVALFLGMAGAGDVLEGAGAEPVRAEK